MPWNWVVSPGDDDQFIQSQALRQFSEARGHLIPGTYKSFAAQGFYGGTFGIGVRICGRFLRRYQLFANALLEPHTPILARHQQPSRLGFGIRGERPDADGRLRLGVACTGAIQATIQFQRLLDTSTIAEEISIRIRQTKMCGELRSLI